MKKELSGLAALLGLISGSHLARADESCLETAESDQPVLFVTNESGQVVCAIPTTGETSEALEYLDVKSTINSTNDSSDSCSDNIIEPIVE